jgi:hypothetical protein
MDSKQIFYIVLSFVIGIIATTGVMTYAWSSTWNGTSWITNGGVIDTQKIAENFEYLKQKADVAESGGGVPSGAVMAFNLSSCPSGWSEYTPARGRFLRGIDTTGSTSIDPSGYRSPGHVQGEAFASHTHNIPSSSIGYGAGPSVGGTRTNVVYQDVISKVTGGVETRPDNVAVLYCVRN